MSITETELKKLIGVRSEIEKITTLSSDGRNLLTRIPKEIRESLGLEKGDKIRWTVGEDNKLCIDIIK